jgi:hypothetical protein
MTAYIYNDLIAKDGAIEIPEGAVPLSQILQVFEGAKEVNWNEIINVLEDKKDEIAVLTTVDDILKIIGVFLPPAAIASGAIGLLILFMTYTHPSQPYTIPGYHWDALYGWVPDTQQGE